MKDLPEDACKAFLRGHRVGVMCLARDNEAYGVPLFYAYDGYDLFFHSRPGEKDDFLGETRRGCFVVLEVQSDDVWTSVEARGPVKRIDSNVDAERAFKAIAENPFPPAFGVDVRGNPQRSGKGSYLWMMKPREITGRISQPTTRTK